MTTLALNSISCEYDGIKITKKNNYWNNKRSNDIRNPPPRLAACPCPCHTLNLEASNLISQNFQQTRKSHIGIHSMKSSLNGRIQIMICRGEIAQDAVDNFG